MKQILRTDIKLLICIPILAAISLAALLGPWMVSHDPLAINPANLLQSPSGDHWLGTDELGRDILSRMVQGARVSLSVALCAVVISIAIGIPVGIASAYVGGWIDNLVTRITDLLICIPEIFVAIFVMALFDNSLATLTITIGLLYFPQFAKVTHAVALTLKERDFVLASVALGARRSRIMFLEIMPNMTSVILVQMSFTLSFAMLLEAGLSFLGLGVVPPQPSWGSMVGTLKEFLFINPVPVIFPAVALFATIFAINLLGDWFQDYLDPEIVR
jgi:peptide/nickel transport system permease protein